MPKTISAAGFMGRLRKGEAGLIVDIRTDGEYIKARLKSPTIHVPLNMLTAARLKELAGDSGKPVYLLCRSDTRARYAVEKLEKEGMRNILVIEGGIMACMALGAETISGEDRS